ncbi:MAG: hypothetical protein AAFO79_00285 [Pseudomonadota bacterium]
MTGRQAVLDREEAAIAAMHTEVQQRQDRAVASAWDHPALAGLIQSAQSMANFTASWAQPDSKAHRYATKLQHSLDSIAEAKKRGDDVAEENAGGRHGQE